VALIFNNLIINKSHPKYVPFLLNLLSGRRRALSNTEFASVISMLDKTPIDFNDAEKELYRSLTAEKQFISDTDRSLIEKKITEQCFFENIIAPDLPELYFSIQLTQACNMSCGYCYEQLYQNPTLRITTAHIDSIADFLNHYCSLYGTEVSNPYIRITGGEPLVDASCVDMINYIVDTWPDCSIELQTNGINVLKYYNGLPIENIKKIHVSLDGLKDTHIARRYSVPIENGDAIYENILQGIIKILADGKMEVILKTTVDMRNYKEIPAFKEYLRQRNISTSPHFKHNIGYLLDFTNEYDLYSDRKITQTVYDLFTISEHLQEAIAPVSSMSVLAEIMTRSHNTPYSPRDRRCNTAPLKNYYFSPTGNVYLCDCPNIDTGIVGTYYPEASLYEEVITELKNRNVFKVEKCKPCAYKFVCLGNCPLSSLTKRTEVSCGIFANEEILDNLQFNYFGEKDSC